MTRHKNNTLRLTVASRTPISNFSLNSGRFIATRLLCEFRASMRLTNHGDINHLRYRYQR